MRILHTADLHLGQVLYQYYLRDDEHDYFFTQLEAWCQRYSPDVLVVCGDLYDVSQPGAHVRSVFNSRFSDLHRRFPAMHIVLVAGNHDSPSRIQADRSLWQLGGVTVVGAAPAASLLQQPQGWQEDYMVRVASGYVVTLPFCVAWNSTLVQALLDYVAAENHDGLPVVMTAHQTVEGSDFMGHLSPDQDTIPTEVGGLRSLSVDALGHGFDYLALGHIHRPQTIGYPVADEFGTESHYDRPVARYSGSPLHVSCNENYPHSVSLVDIQQHGGGLHLTRLPVDQRRHFFDVPRPPQPPAASYDDLLSAIDGVFATEGPAYIRPRIDYNAIMPSDLPNRLYRKFADETHDELRLNPAFVWENQPVANDDERPTFEIAQLQQMDNPLDFVQQTIDHYPGLDCDRLPDLFAAIEVEIKRLDEEENARPRRAAARTASPSTTENN